VVLRGDGLGERQHLLVCIPGFGTLAQGYRKIKAQRRHCANRAAHIKDAT